MLTLRPANADSALLPMRDELMHARLPACPAELGGLAACQYDKVLLEPR